MRSRNKVSKLKKGAWFVPVRGSYLPKTHEAWYLHALLLLLSLGVIASAYSDTRRPGVVIFTMLLELSGLGAIFTLIAAKKS